MVGVQVGNGTSQTNQPLHSPVRRGPKFEITLDMVVANVKTVCARLGVSTLTTELYDEHGSFAVRAIERKWKWSVICALAGVQSGRAGKKKVIWNLCMECLLRYGTSRYCRTCSMRMKRNSRGALA